MSVFRKNRMSNRCCGFNRTVSFIPHGGPKWTYERKAKGTRQVAESCRGKTNLRTGCETDALGGTAGAATSSQPAMNGNTRFVVLYIEDNPLNVKLVQAALKNHSGIELLVAGTAEDGLKIAEEEYPNLILMDIGLPGIDGVTATNILKDISATCDIPVVALSAAVHQEDVDRALKAGCSAYLTKPLEFQALYELINIVRLAR